MPSKMGNLSTSTNHRKSRGDKKLYIPPHLRRLEEAPDAPKKVVPCHEEPRGDAKQWVPPHLRGIVKEPTSSVMASIDPEKARADEVSAFLPDLRGIQGPPIVTKKEWISPHLRGARESRCAPVVEHNEERCIQRYDKNHSLVPNIANFQLTMDASTTSRMLHSYYFSESFKRSGRHFPPTRTTLTQQFAKDENPADFDLSHIFKPRMVKDYRFDNDSSCVGTIGAHFDYAHDKHPDGWDVPDPKGMEEIIRELAMAHDEKGNWKTIEHWDSRPGFMPDPTHFQGILAYMQGCVDEAFNDSVDFDTSNPLYLSGESGSSGLDWCLLDPIPSPATKPADDGFTQNVENSQQTALKASFALCQTIEKKKQADKAKRKEVLRARAEARAACLAHIPPPNLYIPNANIYLRPVEVGDMQQIADIYNHYVNNNPVVTDTHLTSREYWLATWQETEHEQCLPFLIAVCRSQRTSSTSRRRRRYDGLPEENVVGFSFAKEWYMGNEAKYSGTVQVQIFVDPGHPHVGIGKNLLDQMMEFLDISHCFHNGCKSIKPADSSIYGPSGGARRPTRVVVDIPFYSGEEDALKWQKEWLWAHFYFDQVAKMPGSGEKNGRKFCVATFMRDTGVGCRHFARDEMTGKCTPAHLLTGFVKLDTNESRSSD